MPEPSLVGVETATGRLKNCTSLPTDQIAAEIIKAGSEKLYSEIHKFIRFIWNNEEPPSNVTILLLYRSIKGVMRLNEIIIEEYPSYQLVTKFYPKFMILLAKFIA
jgi:hypothetical protein